MPDNLPKTITSSRLRGEAITVSHAEELMTLYGDEHVMETLSADGKPWDLPRVEEALKRYEHTWQERGFGLYTFWDISGELIGRGGLAIKTIDGEEFMEVAWAVVAHRWGQGFATEMGRLAIDVAAKHTNVREVIALTLPHNKPSRRVMEKLGFEFDDVVEHAGLPHVMYRRCIDR